MRPTQAPGVRLKLRRSDLQTVISQLLLLASLAGLALGLGPRSLAQATPPTQAQEPAREGSASQPAAPPTQAPSPRQTPQAEPEHRITRAEADELLRSIDAIVQFDSRDTGLRLHHNIKRKFTSRDEVARFVSDRFSEDEQAQRLKRSEVVLKRFGLIPRNFHLEPFMLELLKEQVAGYYNSKDKTVYLLDWVEPESQKPVMAHELTHALQDQNFGIEKWMGKNPKAGSKMQTEIQSDEQMAAREAVVEGQAMIAMLDYMLAPAGQSVLTAPLLVQAMEAGMMDGDNSPVFTRAPLYLKEVLVFPYTYGTEFVRELLARGGKERAFAGVFKNPPLDTRQIMEPKTYLAGERTPPLELPNLEQLLGAAWEKYDVGSIGEFDVKVMAEQYGVPSEDAKLVASNWRGGYYYAAKKKGVSDTKPENIALIYVSRWASPEAATNFGEIFGAAIQKRYRVEAGRGERQEIKTRPDVDANSASAGAGLRDAWRTDDGLISVETRGAILLITEGFDDASPVKDAAYSAATGQR